MAIFAIISQPNANAARLSGAIKSHYGDAIYDLGNGVWLVPDSTTAKDVSDKLGVTTGENGAAVILEAASYFGRANPAVWSWIKAKWEGAGNG